MPSPGRKYVQLVDSNSLSAFNKAGSHRIDHRDQVDALQETACARGAGGEMPLRLPGYDILGSCAPNGIDCKLPEAAFFLPSWIKHMVKGMQPIICIHLRLV